MSSESDEPDDYVKAMMSPSSPDDKVVCRECYDEFGQITASHLSLHGMTTEEYREKHPGAPLQSKAVRDASGWNSDAHGESTRSRISQAIKEKHENGDYNDNNQ